MYKIEDNISFFDELEKEEVISDNVCYISNLPLEKDYTILKCGHKFNSYYIFNEFFHKRFDKFMFIHAKLLKYKLTCPYCRNIQYETIPYYEKKGISKIYGINDLECENYKQNWRCQYLKKTKEICHSNYVMPFKETGIYYCEKHHPIIQKRYLKEINKTKKEKKKKLENDIILCTTIKCSFKEKRKCPNKLFKDELCKKHYHLKINTI